MEKLTGQLNNKFREFLDLYMTNNFSEHINIILDFGQRTDIIKVSCEIKYSIFEIVSNDSSNVNIILKKSFINLIKHLNTNNQLCIINNLYYEYDDSIKESYIICEYSIINTDNNIWSNY